MRLLGILVVAAVVASGASAMEETIYPGVGIGKLKLGMTRGAGRARAGEGLRGQREQSELYGTRVELQ
jgi:hypothetical protein